MKKYIKQLTPLVVIVLLISSFLTETKLYGQSTFCNTCPQVSFDDATYILYNGQCVTCKVIVNYKVRKNTCVNPPALEIRLGNIIIPDGCAGTCGFNPFTEALYGMLTLEASRRFEVNHNSVFYKRTPVIMSTNPTCWKARNITPGIAVSEGLVNLNTTYPVVDLGYNLASATFQNYGQEASPLENPSGGYENVPYELIDWTPYETLSLYEPCSESCCRFDYIVQRNNKTQGQKVDVYLAQSTTTYTQVCLIDNLYFEPTEICQYKCQYMAEFTKWPPFAKRGNYLNEAFNNDEKSYIESTVSPNPANRTIEIKSSIPFSDLEITVLDATGNSVYTNKFKDNININLESFANGTYFYYISTKNEIYSKGKFNVTK